MKKKIKVAVAMSGGVDSGVAAGLLVQAGYEVTGIHMKLWRENKCLASSGLASSLESARKTAKVLGIPFQVIDFSKIFKKRVVDYFLTEYAKGLTPNPCVKCNKFIKFGELLDYVRRLGYDYLATGHYARIVNDCLFQGKDKTKDQSYFLYNLRQPQLAHILFPVGGYTKKKVRGMAREWSLPAGRQGLSVAERPESQEICFIAGNNYRPFLQRQINNSIKPGEVVDTKGQVIGKHSGLPLYTIGQRHGFSIIQNSTLPAGRQEFKIQNLIPPYYVIAKDARNNQLVVGFGQETEKKEFWVKEVNWVNSNCTIDQLYNCSISVRVRHQGELLKCKVQSVTLPAGRQEFKIKVILNEPERGIAPGQAAVFYLKEEVLGGGTII